MLESPGRSWHFGLVAWPNAAPMGSVAVQQEIHLSTVTQCLYTYIHADTFSHASFCPVSVTPPPPKPRPRVRKNQGYMHYPRNDLDA